MSTPNSASAAFCTPAQFFARCDFRSVAQLLTDGGPVPATAAAMYTNQTLLDLLGEGAGMIESGCTVSNRYTIVDLTGLTGNSLQMLVGMNAGLTLWLIWERRPNDKPLPSRAQAAMELLSKLSEGIAIFGYQEHASAGVLDHNVDRNSDIEARALLPIAARRYFGTRSSENNG